MCGIAGVIDPILAPDERSAAVGRMCDAMIHRGPDDWGIESRDGATLGTRRLAIFDPANGHQPMTTADGRFTISFNGAIYNFKELRLELASIGWTFRTNCDTEVLLYSWVQWCSGCLSRLRGMYAFALWDDREKTLQLARDPLGIKPLYYHHEGERLLFASEINAILVSGLYSTEIDPLSVSDYLAWLAVPAPRTIYKGVFSLRPGEVATFKQGHFEIRSAWNFRSIPKIEEPCQTRSEFIHELRARLEDSAKAHVLADVPVGAFLSGGLDSAVIAGLMAKALGTRLRTFSIGFEEPGYSESDEAEATARHLGAEHQTRILTGAEVAGDIERFVAACDQPTGDGINTYYASQTARAGGVTVALSGLGGDELFGGYPSFRQTPQIAGWLPWWRAIPSKPRGLLLAKLRSGHTRQRKLADFLDYTSNVHEVSAMQRRVFSELGRRSLLGPAPLAALADRPPFHSELPALRVDLADADVLTMVSGWEMRTYMADVLLRDSDVMSMRHSLELRVPLVDRLLIEWLWRQPSGFKFTPRHPKSALAAAVADLLPPGMSRRQKRGFTLPIGVWMHRELKPFLDEAFSNKSVDRTGLFNRVAVQSSWHRFLKQEDAPDWSRVWSLAILVAFVNRAASVRPGIRDPSLQVPSLSTVSPLRNPNAAAGVSPNPQGSQPRSGNPPGWVIGDPPKAFTLLLTPEIFMTFGGIARMTQIYLKALCELGVEQKRGVRLLALNDTALDSRDTRRFTGGTLNDWFVCSGNKRRFVREALRMSRGCDQLICGHVAQLPVAWLARRLNPKLRYYLVAHGIEVWRPFTLLERVAIRGAAKIFCVSEYTRSELQKYCSVRPGRAVVLPNALDPTLFKLRSGRPLADCPPVILTVSRLSYADRYKGVEHLIAAMPAIRAAEPKVELHVIGGGDDLPRLQSLARSQGLLGNAIVFLGPLDDKAVAAKMSEVRLFALPSGREGFGLVYLEAMANGRPCLGARAGGVPEVITEDTGVLVEFANVAEIAAGCIAALRWDWREEPIVAQARHFSYELFKQRLTTLLNT